MRGDLRESEDVLVGLVAADTDLAPGDGERLRAPACVPSPRGTTGTLGRLALDVIALVVGRHLDRVTPMSAFDGHHGVNGGSFDSGALTGPIGDSWVPHPSSEDSSPAGTISAPPVMTGGSDDS